ncbi:hypothetical protein L1887_20063 [Cichorium endivia]|nr:hypothetical protein L1887_20063 [Cichorium endivia]
MQPPQQHSWINLAELKTQMIRKLGPEKSKQYFDFLNRFLSLKLCKVEFDKLCLRTVGREGIPLHNQLIRSILRNACTKVPVGNKKPSDGPYQNGSNPVVTRAPNPLVFPNGDILSPTQRKTRTGARRSALAPNGKTNSSSLDTQRPVQHHQELIHQPEHKVVSSKIPLDAPLGIPYCPVSIGGARKAPPIKSVGVSDTNSLLDTITLRARMEPIAATQGLQGVSVNCANTVNNGLDAYLKGLIRSCCELNKARLGHGPIKTGPISLLDFRVAMEINPRQLGEDWPVLLEKICTQAFEQ